MIKSKYYKKYDIKVLVFLTDYYIFFIVARGRITYIVISSETTVKKKKSVAFWTKNNKKSLFVISGLNYIFTKQRFILIKYI